MSPDNFTHSACIGLGSNLGQSRKLLQDGWRALGEYPNIYPEILSSPYRTRPVGMDSPHWFINAVGLLKTSMGPEELLEILLQVEQQLGRIRSPNQSEYQDRTIDLDLLLFDELVMHSSELTLPHPSMHERLFVLVPLAEVAPEWHHPLLDKTITDLLAGLGPVSDREQIERVSWQE